MSKKYKINISIRYQAQDTPLKSFELDEDCFETPIKLKELLPFKDEAYLTISLDEIHDTETED